MSIAICRVDKCSSAHDIAGIQIHNRRERQHSNSNPDIDFNRSKDNYSLCSLANGKSYKSVIDEIIAAEYTSSRAIRKDAVRMVQVLFTSDSDFFAGKSIEEQKNFFTDCYKWAADKWGESHIISADVHMDEKTPHMHLNFVPLVQDLDKKTGKEITTLNVHKAVGSGSKALQQLQDDFYKSVGKNWGLDRGNKSDLTSKPRKNLRTEQYKEATNYHQSNINALERRSQALQDTIEAREGQLDTLEQEIQQRSLTLAELEKLQRQNDELSERVRTLEERERILEAQKSFACKIRELFSSKHIRAEYSDKLNDVKATADRITSIMDERKQERENPNRRSGYDR